MSLRHYTIVIIFLNLFAIEVYANDSLELRIDSLFVSSVNHNDILTIAKQMVWDNEIICNIPSIPPVLPLNFRSVHISSSYGYRIHPISQKRHIHSGIDIPPYPDNDTIYAPAHGIVDTIGFDNRLGLFVKLRHKYNYETTYGHLAHFIVQPGEVIRRGSPIAIMGTTGTSTGKHLHYTVKFRGTTIPPLPYCYLLLDILSLKYDTKE